MGPTTERVLLHTLASFFFAAVLSLSGLTGFPAAQAAEPTSQGASSKQTRFIVGLDRHADFNIMSLTKPNRVVVELQDVKLQLPPQPKSGPIGLVSGFHGGRSGPKKTRIVINVTEPVVVTSTKIEPVGDSYHLFLEIAPLTAGKPARKLAEAPFGQPSGLGAGGLQPPMPRQAVSRETLNKRRAKPIIVLDPGHGGHDSGAKKNGAVEKQVVLEFAHTLRKQLEASGRYKVLMTREKDEFVELAERRRFAERNNANLFIAIHADYARSSASGAAIFTLRPSVAKRLKKSAMKSAGKIDISDTNVAPLERNDRNVVKNWLSDLARQDVQATNVRSNLFSRSIVRHVGSKTNFRSEPHRQAAFKVLKTQLVPSVLIELAFVTNKADAKRLKSETWRKNVSSGIVTAIDNYFSHHAARLPILAGIN